LLEIKLNLKIAQSGCPSSKRNVWVVELKRSRNVQGKISFPQVFDWWKARIQITHASSENMVITDSYGRRAKYHETEDWVTGMQCSLWNM
jgi:hypothetical protein